MQILYVAFYIREWRPGDVAQWSWACLACAKVWGGPSAPQTTRKKYRYIIRGLSIQRF